MKRRFVCIILTMLLIGNCISAFGEVNMNYYVSNVQAVQNEEYSKDIKAAVYGFEETDNLSLRVGKLKNPDNVLTDKMSEYKTENEKCIFVELTAFDTKQNLKVTISDMNDMQITLSTSGLGSGFAGCMGKEYKVFKVADTAEELKVVESSLYDVTFETNELGIYAIVYNPYAISLSFMLDKENKYCQIDNLCISSAVEMPEVPTKEGYKFAGWYQRENGEGLCLYPGITLAEIATSVVYAYWVEDKYPYVIEGMSLLSASGEELTDIPTDSSFITEVTLSKVKDRNAKDYIFVAAYGTDGRLLNLDYVKADFVVNSEYSFGFNIPVQKESIGLIRAYVWNDFSSMESLAESKMINKVQSAETEN